MTTSEKYPSYHPPIPENLRTEYERGLAGILRWKDGILSSSTIESDLDHVRDMLLILEDIGQKFIHIPNEVNSTTVAHMIYIHDAGEILAGDLVHFHPNYFDLKPKVKRREIATFRLITRSLEDKSIKNLSRDLYKRVHRKSPDDKEAQLTDYIDKVQAIRFGLENVFPAKKLKNKEKRRIQLNHTIEVLLKPAIALLSSLDSTHSREEAEKMIFGDLSNFLLYGYREQEIQTYVNLFYSNLQKIKSHR